MLISTRSAASRTALAACAALVLAAGANAAVTTYTATLNGANEEPPNNSPGIGTCQVDIDPVAHTMRVQVNFSGLLGNTTACHIHAATPTAFMGVAGVATQTPSFAGFPNGVTAGSYDMTFDTTQASSFNSAFVTAHGGTAAGAEAFLFQAIAEGKAYLNVHSTSFGGGEIRGFLKNCYPDCNGVGGLTIADFGCFQTRFVANDPYADCNGVGGLTIADFGCFQTKFVAGCP